VLISRTLSVCGEVAERLKAAVCSYEAGGCQAPVFMCDQRDTSIEAVGVGPS
jgi:hypothetical protein